MKTFLAIYILGFVSIIVLYVHDNRGPEQGGYFDPRAVAAQARRMTPAPDDFETEGTAGQPEPVTVAPGTGAPETGHTEQAPGETDALPNTFEGLNERISMLSSLAEGDPDLNIRIAQCHYRKAEMYRARIMELKLREENAGPEEKYKLANRQELLEGMRIESLWKAIGALSKLPRNVYEDTDIRMLKALIYLDLPNQAPLAVSELRKLADDPDSREDLRKHARILIEKYGGGQEK